MDRVLSMCDSPQLRERRGEVELELHGARRAAAAAALQRSWRRWLRLRPANTTDPITLEKIAWGRERDQGTALFRCSSGGGRPTVMEALPLAEYGLATGVLTNPLSRQPLVPLSRRAASCAASHRFAPLKHLAWFCAQDACEVLRLEHTLLNAGHSQYANLRGLMQAAADKKKVSQGLSLLSHSGSSPWTTDLSPNAPVQYYCPPYCAVLNSFCRDARRANCRPAQTVRRPPWTVSLSRDIL
jgi:hypothetical protein